MDKIKKDKRTYKDELEVLTKLSDALENGVPARSAGLEGAEIDLIEGLQLLSMKKVNCYIIFKILYRCLVADLVYHRSSTPPMCPTAIWRLVTRCPRPCLRSQRKKTLQQCECPLRWA